MTQTNFKLIKKIKIGLVSSREIQEWGERRLPDGSFVGEILNDKTIHYKTKKPEPNGLFCQKIFGPIKDNSCACTKLTKKDRLRQSQLNHKFCDICNVERTSSKVRRYRFGHILLKHSIIHPFFLSRTSSLSHCLDWSNLRINKVASTTDFCYLSNKFFNFSPGNQISTFIINRQKNQYSSPEDNQIIALNQQKNPRLFINDPQLFNNLNEKTYSKLKEPSEVMIYGINYDMTWNDLKKIEDFFKYMWDSPLIKDYLNPAYYYRKELKNYNSTHQIRYSEKNAEYYTVQPFPILTGGNLIEKILSNYHPTDLIKQIEFENLEISKSLDFLKDFLTMNQDLKKNKEEFENYFNSFQNIKQLNKKYSQRLKILRNFYLNDIQPAWITLNCLPVLPSDLRPIAKIDDQFITSELNHLYKKVVQTNQRIQILGVFNLTDVVFSFHWNLWCLNIKLLQESATNLFYTGDTDFFSFKAQNNYLNKSKNPISLLNVFKGKQGRFRQHILGKRVDYSGRSVIVAGPSLKIYECGLPFDMAVDLFLPYIIQKLHARGVPIKTRKAKDFILEYRAELWDILSSIIEGHPILLNRAPTLHRLGIQAFLPKLILEKAIQLHPLVCSAYNADFDGDQMAVHIPLSLMAQSEAIHLLWSSNLLLAPASGQPLLLPTQDMILGCFYLSSSVSLLKTNITLKETAGFLKKNQYFHEFVNNFLKNYILSFSQLDKVFNALNEKKITMHTPVWVIWNFNYQKLISKKQALISDLSLEYQIDFFGNTTVIKKDRYILKTSSNYLYIRTTPGRLFLNRKTFNI